MSLDTFDVLSSSDSSTWARAAAAFGAPSFCITLPTFLVVGAGLATAATGFFFYGIGTSLGLAFP